MMKIMDMDLLDKLIETAHNFEEIAEELCADVGEIKSILREKGVVLKGGQAKKNVVPPNTPGYGPCSCGEADSSKFYFGKYKYCSSCCTKQVRARKKENSDKIYQHMGGKCACCGYSKYRSGLSNHHLDPKKKDTKFSDIIGWSWKRIEKELENCTCLCNCCHSAYHSRQLDDESMYILAKITLEKGLELPEVLNSFTSITATGVEPVTFSV